MSEEKRSAFVDVNIAKAVLCESIKHEGPLFRKCAGKEVLVDLTSIKVIEIKGERNIFAKFGSTKKLGYGIKQVNVKYLLRRDKVLHEAIMQAS